MAEVAGLAASIIAILELTESVVDYVKSYRGAAKERGKLLKELSCTSSLLAQLKSRLDESNTAKWMQAVQQLGGVDGALQQFQDAVTALKKKMQSTSPQRKFIRNLVWHFTKSDIEHLLDRCARLQELCSAAMLNDLMSLTLIIESDVKNITITLMRIEDDQNWQKIRSWLAAPDPSSNYEFGLSRRHPKTGLWFVQGRAFAKWKQQPGHAANNTAQKYLIWLYGKPGCGKSVLSATIIEDLIPLKVIGNTAVIYFYFDFNDSSKQRFDKCLCSLLLQATAQSSKLSPELLTLYEHCEKGQRQPRLDDLKSTLIKVLSDFSNSYIVLDALDECPERDGLLQWLESLPSQLPQSLRLLVLSRNEEDIAEELEAVANPAISIEDAVVDSDIREYVGSQLKNDKRFRAWPSAIRDEVETVLCAKAEGMYDTAPRRTSVYMS